MSSNRIQLRRAIEEAEGYLELGMREAVFSALERRHSLVQSNGRACYLLGETLRELLATKRPYCRWSEAPTWCRTIFTSGWRWLVLQADRQTRQSDRSVEHAVEVDPGEAIIHYNLACYWSLARNRVLALRYLSHALEMDANFRDMVLDEPDFQPLRHDPEFLQLTGLGVKEI